MWGGGSDGASARNEGLRGAPLTWMGVPDRMMRKLAASCFTALESLVLPFLIT